jgi:hypothetical protein
MQLPKGLRKQLKAHADAGFNAVKVEHRAGSHYKVWYAEIADKPQIVTQNDKGPRVLVNTLARYRRILRGDA